MPLSGFGVVHWGMYRVLITGSTGCVGHYVTEALLARGDCQLHLLARDPGKFQFPLPAGRAEFLVDDVRNLEANAELLGQLDAVVHLATAWGDPVSYPINVDATLTLARLVPAHCRIFYFSTASILDDENRPMPVAEAEGTDYIRSKYLAYQAIADLPNRDRIITMFPTLIFGGSDRHPVSHVSKGIPEIVRWLWVLRWFNLEGSLHFIHAADIARMVSHLLDHDPPERDLVLGNAAVTVDALLGQLCDYHALPRRNPIDLSPFAGGIAAIAGDRMNSWDRYCLKHRHFRYRAVNPRALGMEPGLETIGDIVNELTGQKRP